MKRVFDLYIGNDLESCENSELLFADKYKKLLIRYRETLTKTQMMDCVEKYLDSARDTCHIAPLIIIAKDDDNA